MSDTLITLCNDCGHIGHAPRPCDQCNNCPASLLEQYSPEELRGRSLTYMTIEDDANLSKEEKAQLRPFQRTAQNFLELPDELEGLEDEMWNNLRLTLPQNEWTKLYKQRPRMHHSSYNQMLLGKWDNKEEPEGKSYYHGDRVMLIIEYYSLSFYVGNAVKYILRAGKKSDDVLDDLKKALWYLERKMTHGTIDRSGRNPKDFSKVDPMFQFPRIENEFNLDAQMGLILGLTIACENDTSFVRDRHLKQAVIELGHYIKDIPF